MSLPISPTDLNHQATVVQFSMPLPVARRLRVVLIGLLRALEDRETQNAKVRVRRREAHAAVEGLLVTLGAALGAVGPVEEAASSE